MSNELGKRTKGSIIIKCIKLNTEGEHDELFNGIAIASKNGIEKIYDGLVKKVKSVIIIAHCLTIHTGTFTSQVTDKQNK